MPGQSGVMQVQLGVMLGQSGVMQGQLGVCKVSRVMQGRLGHARLVRGHGRQRRK